MDITTRHDYGDKLFFIENNEVNTGTVIEIRMTLSQSTQIEQYKVTSRGYREPNERWVNGHLSSA
jgi:hypothetical protein